MKPRTKKPRTKKELIKLINTVKDLNSIDTSLITNMEGLFDGARFFNQPLNNWDVSRVRDMRCMFESAIMYTHSMSDWELKCNCKTTNFLKRCPMWPRYNTIDDMPLQDGKRLEAPADLKKTWGSK